MTTIFRRLRYFLGRSDHEADLLQKIEAHRALRQDALERHGLSPDVAALRNAARSCRPDAATTAGPLGMYHQPTWRHFRFIPDVASVSSSYRVPPGCKTL